MKFNQKELAAYGASKIGNADKEGLLCMRESDGIIRRKETYFQRWFMLSGNLLFYTKENTHDSLVVGAIILERCKVESEAYSGNRNAFRLVFQDSDIGYWFFADSAREADEWITILNCASYEYLRTQYSELRGQLMHLTGKDPIGQGGPLGEWSVNAIPTLPTSAPGYDGEPVFELSLACSSLIGGVGEATPPCPLIVTHCMTPPQAYWIRYAQTEVIENNCDPQFTTPVVFFEGSVFSSSQLKFEIFDVCNRLEGMMRPLGQVQCTVKDLVKRVETKRYEINFDDKISGFLVIQIKMSGRREQARPLGIVTSQLSYNSQDLSPGQQAFTFRSPLDNIVVRRFHFPLYNVQDHQLHVTEIMGECVFTFTIPIQILEMCISEEHASIGQYSTLSGLKEHWEIVRQEIVMELRNLVQYYEKSCEALRVEMESGKLFKKSVTKDNHLLEFVPVNLHIQEMKVSQNKDEKERVSYTCVTVGCPTAYSLKYRHGGLARIQASIPRLAIGGSFSPATENKTLRVKTLLKRISQDQMNIKTKSELLKSIAQVSDYSKLETTIRSLVDAVAMFENHCNIMILKDALADWYNGLEVKQIPSFISSLTELNPKSILTCIEQHMVCVEAQVDGVIKNRSSPSECNSCINRPISDLLKAMDDSIYIFQSALFFVLLKEHYHLQLHKIPVGMKGYRHRRDIVFTHAVTAAVTCFVMKLLRSISSRHFLNQLLEIGFLIHWESLLSTQGDENGMLEDFIVAIHDLNTLKFKLVQAQSVNDLPRVHGVRYKVTVEVPVQIPMFRILPSALRNGKEINTVAVLFTQGVNEQQSIADTFGDSHLQDQINIKSLQRLTAYCERFRERFGTSGIPLSRKAKEVADLLQQLRSQIHTRKAKNTDILTLSQALCRTLECGRLTSCKSAKDRTAMAVTLEEAHILLNFNMDQLHFQQTLDVLRSQGTRIRNAEKNVGVPLYAFNALQVVTLPKNYRPPEGTYKKLQT